MDLMSEKVAFPNDRGMNLAGIIDYDASKEKLPAIVLLNHFTGFKEVTHLFHIQQALVKNGFLVLRFDFGDCIGESKGGSCENMKLSHQVRDVFSAIDFLENHPKVNTFKIGVAGHSLGGTTSIVVAANDTRIKAIVAIAALAKLEWDILFKSKVEEWKKTGFITFPTFKKGDIKIKYGFYRDLSKYDASEIVKKIEVPILIIHPVEDELVTVKNGKSIYENANNPKEFELIKNADHMFTNKKHEKEMIDLTVNWFKKYLIQS